MIVIYMNTEGTAQKVSPSQIYQGSNQSSVTVFANVPTTTAMSIAFKLPDGTNTSYYPMTYIPNSDGLAQYEFTLNASLTQKAGQAAIALMAVFSDGRQTSQLIAFEIEPSVLPELPSSIDEDAYEIIMQYLQKDREDIVAIQSQIDDIQETADNAETAANNAVETANAAKETADGLADSIAQANTKADNAVATANQAESVANEAKATADGLADSIAQANAKSDNAVATANEAKEIAQEALDQAKTTGTQVEVNGVFAEKILFDSDPQTQINERVKESDLFDLVYPVGSIYISATATSPASISSGTWEQIQGRFLLGANGIYTLGSVGGSTQHFHQAGSLYAQLSAQQNGSVAFNYITSVNYNSRYRFITERGEEYVAGQTDGVSVAGATANANSLPPYLAVNIWKRTA